MFEEIRDPQERVRAVCMYGCQVEVDPSIPARRYFRSGMEIIRMANVYHEEQKYESAYILYSKFITLFVEKLPKHPDYKSAPAADKSANKKKLLTIFPKAESVKRALTEIYTTEEEKKREEEKRLANERKALEEKRKKDEEQRKQIEEERKKNLSEQKWLEEEERLRLEQEEEYRRLQEEEIKKRHQLEAAAAAAAAASAGAVAFTNNVQPPPPAYSSVYGPDGTLNSSVVSPSAPPDVNRDLKPILKPDSNSPPMFDRTTKPVDHFTSTGAHSTNAYGLRDIYVPAELMVKFLNLAQQNTSNNIETCGILCGKLAQDAFRITHLIIPKQRGTPDSCDTENEEELFEVQDKYDLITLGWIHTHPSQTAFLSSVDLHTHCSYQLMLPEAIAIVCSPKFNETGFFFLTPDYGLNYISNCRERGFHPHPKDPQLFDTTPHTKLDTNTSVNIVDLRR